MVGVGGEREWSGERPFQLVLRHLAVHDPLLLLLDHVRLVHNGVQSTHEATSSTPLVEKRVITHMGIDAEHHDRAHTVQTLLLLLLGNLHLLGLLLRFLVFRWSLLYDSCLLPSEYLASLVLPPPREPRYRRIPCDPASLPPPQHLPPSRYASTPIHTLTIPRNQIHETLPPCPTR